jgi:hypothetical protein
MKMQRTVFFIILAGVCVSIGLLIQIPSVRAEEGGFGGEFTIGLAHYSGRPSQLEVGVDNERATQLDETADYENYNEAYLAGELHYTLAHLGTTLFLDGESGSADVAVGVSQRLGDAGQITVALSYGMLEVWKDPYLTGVKRQETDSETYGLALAYEEIFGTGAFVSTTTRVVDVDQDDIGDREKKLRRDGDLHEVHLGYRLPLGKSAQLTPSLRAERHNLRGEANASDGAGAALAFEWQQGHWLLEAEAAVGYSEYREDHPLFNKTRKATTYEGTTLLGYKAPFGWSPVTLYALAAYLRSDENISFFDSEGWVTGMGVGIEF